MRSYVHASYAKFLWDVDEEELGVEEQVGDESESPPRYIQGSFCSFPLTTS